MNKKNKKGIFRNALVFLFSVLFTMSAYAADVYAAEYYTAAQKIEQDTIAPTNEMLDGTAWYIAKPEGAVIVTFKDNIFSMGRLDRYGDTFSMIGDYQLNGNEINVSYVAYTYNDDVTTTTLPFYNTTHYIGLTGDGSCLLSIDGIDYIVLERMSN